MDSQWLEIDLERRLCYIFLSFSQSLSFSLSLKRGSRGTTKTDNVEKSLDDEEKSKDEELCALAT
jgi:hypothetical protein